MFAPDQGAFAYLSGLLDGSEGMPGKLRIGVSGDQNIERHYQGPIKAASDRMCFL